MKTHPLAASFLAAMMASPLCLAQSGGWAPPPPQYPPPAQFAPPPPQHASPPPYTWVRSSAGRPLPYGAIEGGWENGHPLYVCRIRNAGGMHPGKIVSGHCNIGYGGREISRSEYEVLVGPRGGSWSFAHGHYNGALVGGSENGRPLYICRADYRGGKHPGKVVANHCNFGFGGAEVSVTRFEVFYPGRR